MLKALLTYLHLKSSATFGTMEEQKINMQREPEDDMEKLKINMQREHEDEMEEQKIEGD